MVYYGGLVWSRYGMVLYGMVSNDMALCTLCISCHCVEVLSVDQKRTYIGSKCIDMHTADSIYIL